MALTLKDRILTPQVAQAMTSPLGILLAGAGAAVGIVAAGPVAGVALGALAWGGRVAASLPSAEPSGIDRVDVGQLQGVWRQFADSAETHRRRFEEAIRHAKDGPLTDRLRDMGERLDDGVANSHRIAQSGQRLEQARRRVDLRSIDGRYQKVRNDLRDPRLPAGTRETLERTADSLQSQRESAGRLEQRINDTGNRLNLIDARLGEIVVRANELAVTAHEVDDLGTLSADVENVVSELESVRQALEETG